MEDFQITFIFVGEDTPKVTGGMGVGNTVWCVGKNDPQLVSKSAELEETSWDPPLPGHLFATPLLTSRFAKSLTSFYGNLQKLLYLLLKIANIWISHSRGRVLYIHLVGLSVGVTIISTFMKTIHEGHKPNLRGQHFSYHVTMTMTHTKTMTIQIQIGALSRWEGIDLL